MKMISSKLTFFIKNILPPLLCAGGLGIGIFAYIDTRNPIALVMAAISAIAPAILGKIYLHPLIDEVYDCNDSLLMKRNDEAETISFTEIVNMAYDHRYKTLTIRLRNNSKFGINPAFIPVLKIHMSEKNETLEDLIVKVDSARLSQRR